MSLAETHVPTIKTVACVGTGVIGRGWVHLFSREGCVTRVYDRDSTQTHRAISWLSDDLTLSVAEGLITPEQAEAQKGRVSVYQDLAEALAGAEYVQESAPERLDAKRSLFAEVDKLASPSAIIASSTSSIDINEFASGLSGEGRCIVAHPFNPPHIVPVVEVMGTKRTDPEVVGRTIDFLTSLGQKPVIVRHFVTGYLINRIQAAVVREAIHLVESGAADVDAVDTIMRDGLGLRWALLGSFGVNNTNADGGIREYYSRFGGLYREVINDLDPTPPSFSSESIEGIGAGVDAMEGKVPLENICRWRDRMILRIRALREEDPHPGRGS